MRPAIAEGHIGQAVLPLSIRDEDRDTETGEYQFPEAHLMQRLHAALVKHTGTPVHKLLAEQEQRLPRGTDGHLRLPPGTAQRTGRRPAPKRAAQAGSMPQSTDATPATPPQPIRYRRRLS